MIRSLTLATALTLLAAPAFAQDAPEDEADPGLEIRYSTEHPGEEEVDAYVQSDANAGTTPVAGDALFMAFHGKDGIGRIVDSALAQGAVDPRTRDIFVAADMVRLRRTLKEQICYTLGGPCTYTGRSMAEAHADQGIQSADFGALVEHMQRAMTEEGIAFRDQNRLLAKLAPLRRDVVTR